MTSVHRVLWVLYAGRGMFLSAAEVAARAGLTARPVASAVAALRERGQAVEESPQGLRLGEPVMLHAHLIEHELGTRRVGRNAICFGEVASTNDVAFDSARQAGSDGLAVLAESQTAGRGRLGRRWVSPRGANLLISALLHDGAGRLSDEALTIAAGLAATEAIEQATGVSPELKWPNDLVLDGAKLGGILVEVRAAPLRSTGPNVPADIPNSSSGGTQDRKNGGKSQTTAARFASIVCPQGRLDLARSPRFIVIGIGLNVNAAPPAEAVGRAAVCLADALGHAVERIELARAMLMRLDHWVGQIEDGRYGQLHDLWRARCGMLGQRARIVSGGRTYEGRVLDVSPLEGLVLSQDSGVTVHLPARTSSVVP